MTKFVITETLLSTIVKPIIVSLYRERFVVVHLYSSFPIAPPKFGVRVRTWDSLPHTKFRKNWGKFWGKFIPKNVGDFGGLKPTF